TYYVQALDRIQNNESAIKPILLGNLEGDGTIWALSFTTLRAVLVLYLKQFADNVTDDQVCTLYPGQNNTIIMADFICDWQYRCRASLWAKAFIDQGEKNVFRYTYGVW
ncbi:uncharacterized protein PHACADRAFT_101236, partial [Phanerochaete carnosa HHB-10118-sp]